MPERSRLCSTRNGRHRGDDRATGALPPVHFVNKLVPDNC